jgi:hypothetical protein
MGYTGLPLPFYSSISHFFAKVNKDISWIIFLSAAIINGCGQLDCVSTTTSNGCKCPILAGFFSSFAFFHHNLMARSHYSWLFTTYVMARSH